MQHKGDTSILYFVDSKRGDITPHVSELDKIFKQVFVPLANLEGNAAASIATHDLSEQGDYQEDDCNCAAFCAWNFIGLLCCQPEDDGLLHLNTTEMTGLEKRKWVLQSLTPLFFPVDEISAEINFDENADIYADYSDHEEDTEVDDDPNPYLTDPLLRASVTQAKKSAIAPKSSLREQKEPAPRVTRSGRIRRDPLSKPPMPKCLRKRGVGRPTLANAAAIGQGCYERPYSVGSMTCECHYCSAMLFAKESREKCCGNGKLEMSPLPAYEGWHNDLCYDTSSNTKYLHDSTRKLGVYYKKNQIAINCQLSFGSVSFNAKDSGVHGAPVRLYNGIIGYNVCYPEGKPGEPLKFAQIYTVEDVDTAIANLKKGLLWPKKKDNVREQLLSDFIDCIKRRHPLARGYKMAYERIQEQRDAGEDHPKWIMAIVDERKVPADLKEPNLHERQKNIQEYPEIAVYFQPLRKGCMAPELPKGVWLWPQKGKPKVNAPYTLLLDSCMFPTIFPNGETWITFDHPLRKPPAKYKEVNEPDEELSLSSDDLDFIPFGERIGDEKEEDPINDQPAGPKHKNASIRMQTTHRLQHRTSDHDVHHIWNNGELGQRLVIKQHFEVVRREFDYYHNRVEKRKVSSKFIRDHYQKLIDEHMPSEELGYVARIPYAHKLSPQYQQRKYADALAMTRKLGAPTFMITVTANPRWPDYLAACQLACTDPEKSPHLICRVFMLKLNMLMHDLTKAKSDGTAMFGKCAAYVVSVEYQKRGNPHAHILLWIDKEDTEVTADFVDRYVSARIPDPKDKDLHTAVLRHNVHLCGGTMQTVCRDPNKPNKVQCSRHFPQRECLNTQIGIGFVRYKRLSNKSGSRVATKNSRPITDLDIVPYNPFLLLKWDGHSNVEAVATQGTPGYAIKYVLKGGSKVFVEILKMGLKDNPYVQKKNGKIEIDESRYFFSMSYVSIHEAFMNLFSYGPFFLSHVVTWLGVHLEKDIGIETVAGEQLEHLKYRVDNLGVRYSRLTAYFCYCNENPDTDLTYADFNEFFNYNSKTFSYRPYKQTRKRIVALYEVNVRNIQLLALRTILLVKKCVKSFEDAATHIDAETGIATTFRSEDGEYDYVAAACAMGLMESDLIWRKALDQRVGYPIRRQLHLFAQVLLEAGSRIAKPVELWDAYKVGMRPNLAYRNPDMDPEILYERANNIALRIVEWHLRGQGKELSHYGLRITDESVPEFNPQQHGEQAVDFLQDKPNAPRARRIFKSVNLGADQKKCFDEIVTALRNATSPDECNEIEPIKFCVQGEAGTGKTTLYNELIRFCEENDIPWAASATTGNAASLLHSGQTLHSLCWVPTEVDEDSVPRMDRQCQRAQSIRSWGLLLVDESSQLHIDVYNFVLKTIRDVRHGRGVVRRLVIVFGGDFQQILPVVPHEDISAAYNASLIRKYYTGEIKFLCLRENHRTDKDQEEFRKWQRALGSGDKPFSKIDDFHSKVKLLPTINIVQNLEQLLNKIFPMHAMNSPDIDIENAPYLRSSILAPLNASVGVINKQVQDRLPAGNKKCTYEAINTAFDEYVDPLDVGAVDAMAEAMAHIEETGLPEQTLTLTVGAKIILIKNIGVQYRLCNGTPAIITQLDDDVITIRRIEVDGALSDEIDILRSVFERRCDLASRKVLRFRRVQFPIKLAFAMTINKAQGQTLENVGLYLNSPVFSPGQAYVACTRGRRASALTIFNPNDTDLIDNVVDPNVRRFIKQIMRPDV
jgi:hypothetical protein